MLLNVLLRAKDLVQQGIEVFAPPALHYFLRHHVDAPFFNSHPEALQNYEELDDSDIWSSLKVWCHHEDKILALLARDLIERRIFRVEVHEEQISEDAIRELQEKLAAKVNVSVDDARYLMSTNLIQKDMYDMNDDHISILGKDGSVRDITDASELFNIALLSKKNRKYYLCYQRF